MYNRYIRNDRGTYTRITEDDGKGRRPPAPPLPGNPPPPPNPSPHKPRPESSDAPPREPPPESSGVPPREPRPDAPREPPPLHRPPPPSSDGLSGFLRHLSNVAHLENVDTGDLLLLCLLFLLYREGADEELLVALGLLLIL